MVCQDSPKSACEKIQKHYEEKLHELIFDMPTVYNHFELKSIALQKISGIGSFFNNLIKSGYFQKIDYQFLPEPYNNVKIALNCAPESVSGIFPHDITKKDEIKIYGAQNLF